MLQSDKDFIRYYDKLFHNKDYSQETNYILKAFEKFGTKKINHILDLGCGTGNHTIEFSNLGYNITGLDLDRLMIDISKSKSDDIDFIYGDIKDYSFDYKFELIFSFFNVINYIDNISAMSDFLSGVYKNLDEGGIFVFDGWNGNQVCIDPPKTKEIYIEDEDFVAKGFLYPNYDAFYNKANFQYKININDNGYEVMYENSLPQTYWTPFVLKQLLGNVGFSSVHIFGHLSTKLAKADDYKLCWICVK